MTQYVSTLLPRDPAAPWVLLATHDSTDDIFERIAEMAEECVFTRDAVLGNVYWRNGAPFVGYWTTLDSLESEIALRERGYKGGEPAARAMSESLAVLD